MKAKTLFGRAGLAVPSLRLRDGLIWSVTGSVFAQGATFIGNTSIANVVGRTSFGEFNLLQSTGLTLAGIAQLATGYTATKYVAEYRTSSPNGAGEVVGACVAICIAAALTCTALVAFGAAWLATAGMKAPHLTEELRIVSVFILFSCVSGCLTGVLAGLECFKLNAKVAGLYGILYLLFGLSGARLLGVMGSVYGLALAGAIQAVCLALAVHYQCAKFGIRIRVGRLQETLAVLFRFSLPAALSGLTGSGAVWIISIITVRSAEGFGLLALYTASASLKGMVMFIPNSINSVAIPILNNQLGLKQIGAYKQTFLTAAVIATLLVLCGTAAIIGAGHYLLMAFGSDFTSGYSVLVIVAITAIPESLTISLSQVVQSHGRMWHSFAHASFIKDVTAVLIAPTMVTSFGARGLAFTYLFSWTVNLAGTARLARALWPRQAAARL